MIAALLEERYGVRSRFSDTSVVCIERVVGTGASVDRMRAGDNPYLAGIGLRVDAAPVGHGIEFSPGIEPGRLPPAFVAATEEGVRSALRQGLRGWAVTDCVVTMTASGYSPRQSRPHQKFDKSISSVAADFRNLAPVVVAAALAPGRDHGVPADRTVRAGGSRRDLRRRRRRCSVDWVRRRWTRRPPVATPGWSATCLPHPCRRSPSRLPDLTSGEGALVTRLDHYAPAPAKSPPTRRRRGLDPLDRADLVPAGAALTRRCDWVRGPCGAHRRGARSAVSLTGQFTDSGPGHAPPDLFFGGDCNVPTSLCLAQRVHAGRGDVGRRRSLDTRRRAGHGAGLRRFVHRLLQAPDERRQGVPLGGRELAPGVRDGRLQRRTGSPTTPRGSGSRTAC